MDVFQGTEKVASWIIYAAMFVAGAAIVGGAIWYLAVQKMRSLVSNNDDNKRWEFGNVQGMLAIIIVSSFVFVVFAFIFKPPNLNAESKETLAILLGFLGGQFVVICSFYYGSTVQNKAKDETVRLTAEAAATTATAQAATAKTMERVVTGTGTGLNGNGGDGGDGHSTTIKVTPPLPPDGVNVGVKITDTSKPDDPKGGKE